MTGSAPGPALPGDEMRVVAELLAAASARHHPVRDAQVLCGRANVVRVRLADGRSAVVKRRAGPERAAAPDQAADFRTELAALEYLNAMPEPVAPRLLGADLTAGLSRRWPDARVPDYPALAGPGAALAAVPGEWQPGQ